MPRLQRVKLSEACPPMQPLVIMLYGEEGQQRREEPNGVNVT